MHCTHRTPSTQNSDAAKKKHGRALSTQRTPVRIRDGSAFVHLFDAASKAMATQVLWFVCRDQVEGTGRAPNRQEVGGTGQASKGLAAARVL
ncbi:MAG: hypothetical protein RBU37_06625 [Myxococcota bacterium]|nr:hypothetical protein [Myxococcota bacterium]